MEASDTVAPSTESEMVAPSITDGSTSASVALVTESSQDNDEVANQKTEPSTVNPIGGFKTPMSIIPGRAVVQKTTGAAAEAFGDRQTPPVGKPQEKVSVERGSRRVTGDVKRQNYATPAEHVKAQNIPIPYKEPAWGGICTQEYSFEVIKNGTVIDTQDLRTKSFYVFGRLPSCDVMMEHPSLSRYHAVVQYCATQNDKHEIGWYLYDLDSTHGTWVNKIKVKPRVYVRLRVGFVIKLGGSTRLHVLQGPSEDQDAESALSVTELQEQRQHQKKQAEVLRQAELAEAESQKMAQESAASDTGCSWGIDDTEEEISSENPFALDATPQNEDLYIEDPKKALRGYFEREGCDLPEYEVVDESKGRYKCQVELPLYDTSGFAIIAEATVSGKKKDAVAACALEACRILDRHGELRKANHESRARKKKNWEENDFYDSDEDVFLDRTGDLEKKRQLRMKRSGKKHNEKADTFDSLMEKLADIDKRITDIETQIQQAKEKKESLDDEGLDVFDAYMMSLKSGALDTKSRMKLKRELFDLRQEKMKLERLAHIAKPALPTVNKTSPTNKPVMVSMFGKMKGPTRGAARVSKPVQKPVAPATQSLDTNVVEEEDDDEEMDSNSRTSLPATPPQPSPSPTSNTNIVRVTDTDKSVPLPPNETPKSRVLGPMLPPQEVSRGASGTTLTSSISQLGRAGPEKSKGDKLLNTNIGADERPSLLSQRLNVDKRTPSVAEGHSDSASRAQTVDSQSPVVTADSISLPHSDVVELKKAAKSDMVHQMSAPVRGPAAKKRKKQKQKSADSDYTDMAEDPDYALWIPPADQSGDGKTHLNEKYGY